MSASASPLATLTLADFEPLVGQAFQASAAGVELTLASVESLGTPHGPGRAPFSLTFTGPQTPALPQQIHELAHDALGPLGIFLVPIAPAQGSDEPRYEAIFS